MSKAGEKLIAAVKDALKVARCKHNWQRLSTRVEGGMVTGHKDFCENCGAILTSFVKSSANRT